MTTRAQLRKAALGLPEVEEGTHVGMLAFAVRGNGFVSVTDEGVVQLRLPDDVVADALEQHPTGERLIRQGTPIGFAIALADINGMHLNNLVRVSWEHCAPKRLVRWVQQASAGDHDLPTAIGRPATSALLLAGVNSLAEVARRSDEELLALHGVGPRAVRILREAITGAG